MKEEVLPTPIGYRVLVKDQVKEKETLGSIVVPDSAREVDGRATVLSVSSCTIDEHGNTRTYPVKVGDNIIIDPLGGHTIVNLKSATYKIVDVNKILAVVND